MRDAAPFALQTNGAWLRLVPLVSCLGWIVSAYAGDIVLTDVTKTSGIGFVHSTGESGKGFLVEGVVGGCVSFDYDNDGLVDIFFTNGKSLLENSAAKPTRHALYRNLGGMKFEDVTDAAGVGFQGFGLGAVAADYDNDGDSDLLITCFGPNVLYRNNGDKTFTDVTQTAGVGGPGKVGAGACFLDVDNDGWLDLFVASYVDFTLQKHVPVMRKGQYLMAGPQYYEKLPDALYRNRGDGTFEDISIASGIASVPGPGMGVVAADFDNDGDVDIFVAQDGAPNLLYQNDGRGHFTEVGLLCGVASNFEGKINGSMGVDCADADGDGLLDLFVTNYQSEMPVLYRNLGDGLFEDATRKAHIPSTLFPHVNWGTGFVDFDNDGHRDLFIANGHFDRVELMDDRTSLKLPNALLQNIGNGTFRDVTANAGDGLRIVESSRGACFEDFDLDGDVDAIVLNSNAAVSVLRNDTDPKGHWLQLKLIGQPQRDAVGARVQVSVGGRTLHEEVHRGRGYQGGYGDSLFFGLGNATRVDGITVRWPNGKKEDFGGSAADHKLTLEQGRSKQ
jgi:hypothetical protein